MPKHQARTTLSALPQERRDWIAVASAEHVRRDVEEGFMQVCHGKAAPLRRLREGDRIAYYSPTDTFRGRDRVQAFTAFGILRGDAIEQYEQDTGFKPFRRAVAWAFAAPAPVQTLLHTPGFALSGPGWGAKLRYGLIMIDAASMDAIAEAMGVMAEP